jgi:hypothetical protein
MAGNISAHNGFQGSNWMPFRAQLDRMLAQQTGAVFDDSAASIVVGAAKPAGSVAYSFVQALLMASGDFFLCPEDHHTIGFYRSATHAYEAGPTHGTGSTTAPNSNTNAYHGALATPDTAVWMMPAQAATFSRWDDVEKKLTHPVPHGFASGTMPAVSAECLGADDAIYFAAGREPAIYRFDWRAMSAPTKVVDLPYTQPASGSSAVIRTLQLLPGGDLLAIGAASSGSWRVNTRLKTVTAFTGAAVAQVGAVLTPSGRRVISFPQNAGFYRQELLDSNVINADVAHGGPTANPFLSGHIMQDGRTVAAPLRDTRLRYLDHLNGVASAGTDLTSFGALSTQDNISHMALMGNGRTYLLNPAGMPNWLEWTPFTGGSPIPLEVARSRFYNHR